MLAVYRTALFGLGLLPQSYAAEIPDADSHTRALFQQGRGPWDGNRGRVGKRKRARETHPCHVGRWGTKGREREGDGKAKEGRGRVAPEGEGTQVTFHSDSHFL